MFSWFYDAWLLNKCQSAWNFIAHYLHLCQIWHQFDCRQNPEYQTIWIKISQNLKLYTFRILFTLDMTRTYLQSTILNIKVRVDPLMAPGWLRSWDCCPTNCPKKNVGTDPLRDYSDAGQKNLHSKPPVVGRGPKIVCVANFSCASASLRQISNFAQHSPPNRRCAISRYKPNKNKLGSGRVQLTQLAAE